MINPFFKLTFFLSLLVITATGLANQEACSEFSEEPTLCCFPQPLIEVKGGYFRFSSSKIRQIYDTGGLDVQLCASYPFQNINSRWTLNTYGAVEYFHRSGKSINGNEKTELWSIPINIGLKPVYSINSNTQYYFAIGPRYLYIHQHNDSPYVYKNKSGNGFGIFVNTGFNYAPWDHFVIDIFGEYSYAKINSHSGRAGVYATSMQIGGLTLGGGLGYEF